MIIIVGTLIVCTCVFGGFVIGGGNLLALVHPNEFIIIGGGALGSLVIMSPRKVLMDIFKGVMTCMKGAPHNRAAYEDLLKVLYELFLIGRRNGMIALEEHVLDPANSAIFKKYPLFNGNKEAVDFLCGSLRPIIDGKIKPDQLRLLLDTEIEQLEIESHAPINVLAKTADSMPGFGIVAAVLGIIITMASITGDVGTIGVDVAAALVGTFLGILLAYGFLNPLATNLEFITGAELEYIKCIASCVIGFAGGMAPVTAVELGRRGLNSELRPTADEMEELFKSVKMEK
jgi:chemotaxis protein MotA